MNKATWNISIQIMTQALLVCALLIVGVLMSVEVQGIDPLTCRVCRNAISIWDCTEQEICSRNEECYTDVVVNPQHIVMFNAGCRSKAMCHGNWSRNPGEIVCSQCCNTTGNSTYYMECNSHLCGLENSHNVPKQTCYFCGDYSLQGPVLDGSKCQKVKFCGGNEVCFVSTIHTGGIIIHQFGCAPKLHCQLHTVLSLERLGITTGIDVPHLTTTSQLTFVGRKRETELCYICCGNNLCNNDDCWKVKGKNCSRDSHNGECEGTC